jgi:DNA-binding transcriptional regulator YdaS (Cro superfamily)
MTEIIQTTVSLVGGAGRVANRLGVGEQTVRAWMMGSAPMPRQAAEVLEDMTGGSVSAQSLATAEEWSVGEDCRLPLVITRCQGEHASLGTCSNRDRCWRHTALDDLGPQTPVVQFMCANGQDSFTKAYGKRRKAR